MSLGLIVRRALLVVATLLLIVLAWWTIAGGLRQLPRSNTLPQQLETAVQLACGLLSALAAFTRFRGRRWAKRVRVAWAISLAVTVGLSGLVWGPPLPVIALLFAAAALLVARAIIWALGTSPAT